MFFKIYRLKENVCCKGLLTACAAKGGILRGLSLYCFILCCCPLIMLSTFFGCNGGSKKTFRLPPASTGGLLSKKVQESKAERGSRYLSVDYLENDYTLGPGDVLDIKVFGGE